MSEIAQVLHGTTVATNAILEGKGATVGLVTTKGFRQVLQIARSYVPGGLAGWIIWPKPEPLAALENTVEVDERIATDGAVVRELDEADVRAQLTKLKGQNIQALAVSLINSFADPAHEKRIAAIAAEVLPGVPVSLSSDVLPEMREYERTLTTVANGYVQPQVKKYMQTLAGPARRGRRRRGARHPAQRRRAAVRGRSHRRPGHDAAVRSGRRRHRRGVGRRAVRLPRPDHLRHGRHLDRRRARPGPHPADRPGDQGRRPHRPRLQRRRPHRGRRRRLDRARARADQGAARRPAVRRRRPRPGRLRQGRHRARRSPTPTSSSGICRRRWPVARSRSTSTRRGPRSARSRRPWAWPHRRPRPRASSTSSTRTCWAACGWSRCSRASTPGTSRWSRSAAPARCTPTRSACSPGPGRSSCRRPRVCSARSATRPPAAATSRPGPS